MSFWQCSKCGFKNAVAANMFSSVKCQSCHSWRIASTSKEESPEIPQSNTGRFDLELLLHGYIREKEEKLDLFMNIPDGIIKLIKSLYPVLLFKFGAFGQEEDIENLFLLNEDRTILKGSDYSCNGYFVYADLGEYNDTGFDKGIHLWSIKLLKPAQCYLSIGVTTEKNEEILAHAANNDDIFNDVGSWMTKGKNSHLDMPAGWDGSEFDKNEIITIELNCDNWAVSYYRNGKLLKIDDIEQDNYYFGMVCCALNEYTHIQVVESKL